MSSQSQVNVKTGVRLSSQDGVSQQQEPAPLSLPQLNRLVEGSFVRDESSVSNVDVAVIPSQHRVHNRYSATGSLSGTSNLGLRALGPQAYPLLQDHGLAGPDQDSP